MFKVIITDEFLAKWKYQIESPEEVCKVVSDWIMNVGETPIYEINVLIED